MPRLYLYTGIESRACVRKLYKAIVGIILLSMDRYPENLGRLRSNIQSLEFILRAFLVNDEIVKGYTFPQSANLHEMNECDPVPENAFTNYDTLGQLIKKYSSHAKISSAGLTIDDSLVSVRDAIAHGRISSATPSSPLKLLKFDKKDCIQTKLCYNQC